MAAMAPPAVGPRRRHRPLRRSDASRPGVATPGGASVLVDGAAALFRVSVSIPDGGGLSPGAARGADAAAENGSPDARRPVSPDAGVGAAAVADRRPPAVVGRDTAAGAAAPDGRDSRSARSRVRPAQPRDRSRLAGRDRGDDAGPAYLARKAGGRGRAVDA